MDGNSSLPVATIVNIIETALTPIFLLAGTAGILNVISSRLTRISDRTNDLADLTIFGEQASSARLKQLALLQRRTLALEISAILAATSAMFTCLSTLGLLAGAVGEDYRDVMLFWFFGLAVITLILAFSAFVFEMWSAARSMMRQIAKDRQRLHRHESDLGSQ
jgi:hypothetical protein